MDIRLPSLGEGADSGTVVNILVKEGDAIQKDQPLLELETEKAVGTVPAPAAGTIEKVRVKVGDKISAGQVIFTVAGGVAASAPAAGSSTPRRAASAPASSARRRTSTCRPRYRGAGWRSSGRSGRRP